MDFPLGESDESNIPALTPTDKYRSKTTGRKKEILLVKMVHTILKQTRCLCRKRAGHRVLPEGSKKAHSSPDFTGI